MIHSITSLEKFNEKRINSPGALFYFSHERCNVCKVLKPKISEMLQASFPKIEMFYCDMELYPKISGQNSIFTVPTILVFFEGKEFLRKSRNIGVEELRNELDRTYSLFID